jgi:hypothetical protein
MPIKRAPFPWDAILNRTGFLLSGWEDITSELQGSLGTQYSQFGEKRSEYLTWHGGVGAARDLGADVPHTMVFKTGADAAKGGVDTSWGPLLPAPVLTDVTVYSGSHQVRCIASYTTPAGVLNVLAAIDKRLYKTTDLVTWAQLGSDFVSNVLNLESFQGSNSLPLLYIAQQHGAYWTWDGTTLQQDSPTAARQGTLTHALRTDDSGATFVDYTAVMTDADTSTTMSTNLAKYASAPAQYLLFGYRKPWTGIYFDLGTMNANASSITVEFFDGTAWVALTGVTDGTATGGKPFAQDGKITWTRPPQTWKRATISNLAGTNALFYIRIWNSGASDFSAGTARNIDYIEYREEASRFISTGKALFRAFDHNHQDWTEDGGITATWFDQSDELGDYQSDFVGLATAQGSVIAKRTTDLAGLNQDGTAGNFMAEWADNPATSSDDQAVASFLNDIYFAHQNGFHQLDLISGNLKSVGMDRLLIGEAMPQLRVTAAVGDRTQFLYCGAYDDAGGTGWIAKFGSIRPGVNPDGTQELIRHDAWHLPLSLGSRKPCALAVVWLSNQPYLLMGDAAGVVGSIKLPKGTHPLDTNSGCTWSTVRSWVQFATFYGEEASRRLTLTAVTVTGRNLTTSGATRTVEIATSDPNSTTWVNQGTWALAPGQEIALPNPHVGYGVNIRLYINNSVAATPVIVDTVTLHYFQEIQGDRHLYRATIKMGARPIRRDGIVCQMNEADWDARLVAAVATPTFDLVTPDGKTVRALIRHVGAAIKPVDVREDVDRVAEVIIATG